MKNYLFITEEELLSYYHWGKINGFFNATTLFLYFIFEQKQKEIVTLRN